MSYAATRRRMFTGAHWDEESGRTRAMADLTFTFGSSYGSGSGYRDIRDFRSHLNFDRAIHGSEAPQESAVISLSDHDPDAFALWRTWIYTGKLAILPDPPLPSDSNDERTAHYAVLAHAYILGDYLVDIPFMNAIADVYVLNARGIDGARALYPSNEEIGVLYDGTSPDSPIRRLLVDIWMYRGKPEWLEREVDEDVLPREFLVEVVRKLLELKKVREGETMSRPWKMTHEQYHDRREVGVQEEMAEAHRCEDEDAPAVGFDDLFPE
ncbi:uncharacterized protein CC84DRAFT_366074 [Paraphaeosphaeria sporulosa]|uniref:BTB domain-containing protein n=1 Tax=Paraphaeosphaeria sporulosa TaxID=1460663 RepID=A0A177BWA6_9PLEO|nr:uncharacterized protein CC84DRAFT_366074 [Paraphaeosphaeria sporulosa]OAF99584.1 hypothetical protein CC84DRAFT_366074 [Paraphaeosphaeria sporulosa]